MEALRLVLYVLHMIAMVAIVLSPVVAALGRTTQVWAARVQLLIGLLLVGVLEMQDASLNHTKIGVKLLVALAVVACAEIANARARRGESHRPLMLAAAGLTVVNALVAFLW